MSELRNKAVLAKSILSNWRMIGLNPSLNLFLLKYMSKFKMINVDGNLIIHSHLPAVNSNAFNRFVSEHLIAKTEGPSHAQIGITNVCPQHCKYCYNKKRSGKLLSTEEIIRIVSDLKKLGVFWLGLTGGEPLMNKDIVKIVESAGEDCAVKLFTTGEGVTEKYAADLKRAGLLYVSVSIDHWDENIHNLVRGSESAFKSAVKAVSIFKSAGLHVSVSSVISREMIKSSQVHKFLEFLISLEVHEAWLSEAKPVVEDFWSEEFVITADEKNKLREIQKQYNKERRITVNYLGDFEDGENFGCNAGNKMIYIDSFGETSPCVFLPMTFGNAHNKPIRDIYNDMKSYFPSDSDCFINKNYMLLKKYSDGKPLLDREHSVKLLEEVSFGKRSEFTRLNNHSGKQPRGDKHENL